MTSLKSEVQSIPTSCFEAQKFPSKSKAYNHFRLLRADIRKQHSEPIFFELNHSGKNVMLANASWKPQPSPQTRLEERIARNKRKLENESYDLSDRLQAQARTETETTRKRKRMKLNTTSEPNTASNSFSFISPASTPCTR